jgi:hypothetical protein
MLLLQVGNGQKHTPTMYRTDKPVQTEGAIQSRKNIPSHRNYMAVQLIRGFSPLFYLSKISRQVTVPAYGV